MIIVEDLEQALVKALQPLATLNAYVEEWEATADLHDGRAVL